MNRPAVKIILTLAGIGAVVLLLLLVRRRFSPEAGPVSTPTQEPAATSAPTSTGAPTAAEPAPLALAVVPLEGGSARSNPCGSLEEPRCGVEQAEAMLGFQLFQPERLPPGVTFSGALAEPLLDTAILVYACGEGCLLTINQRFVNSMLAWIGSGMSGQEETVPIGSHNGAYKFSSNWQSIEWWFPAGSYLNLFDLRIDVHGAPDPASGLDRDGLIALAENIVRITPPSGLIAFESDRDGNPEIYAMEYRQQERTNLTNHPAADHSFAWSPDGERIAFLSDRSGAAEVYVMASDGSGLVQLTQDSPVSWRGRPAWSRDGAHLAVTGGCAPDGSCEIYVVSADGAGYYPVSKGRAAASGPLQWSPDGEWIAFLEAPLPAATEHDPDTMPSRLLGVRLADGRRTRFSPATLQAGDSFAWSPDGRTLAYTSKGDLALADADGSHPHITQVDYYDLGSSGRPSASSIAWSPDGDWIVIQSLMSDGSLIMSLFDFAASERIGLTSIGYLNGAGGLSWSSQGLHLLTALNWREGELRNAEAIQAWLIDGANRTLEGYLFIDSTVLETLPAGSGSLTNPQWQPRPGE